jgi:hypothetical protein
MIVLDTNVVSEMMRAQPNPAVVTKSRGATVATRSVTDFDGCGVLDRESVGPRPGGARLTSLILDHDVV